MRVLRALPQWADTRPRSTGWALRELPHLQAAQLLAQTARCGEQARKLLARIERVERRHERDVARLDGFSARM